MKDVDFDLSVSETTESLNSEGDDITSSHISSEKPADNENDWKGKSSKQLRKHKNASVN